MRLTSLNPSRWGASGVAADTFYVLVTQVVSKGVLTALTVLMARGLSVEQFSRFNYFLVTTGVLTSYVALGLPLVASRVLSEGNLDRSWREDPRTAAMLALAVLASAGAVVASPLFLPWLMADEIRVSAPLIVIGALAAAWNAIGQAAMYAVRAFRQAFWPAMLATAFTCVAASLGVATDQALWPIVGNILFYLAPVLLYWYHLKGAGVTPPHRAVLNPNREAMGQTLAIALPGLGVTVIYATVNWLIARTLVEHQSSPTQFNEYLLGLQWVSLALFVPLGLGQAIFPRFVEASRAGASEVRAIVVPAAITFGSVALIALTASLATPVLDVVYGASYDFDPAFVFTVLLAGAFGGAVNLIGVYVMATRGTAAWFLANLASLGVALPLLSLNPPTSAFAAARVLCGCYAALLTVASFAIWTHHRRSTVAPI